jgi:acyl dehydratase
MLRLHFEDFEPGSVTTYGRHVVSRDEMIAFAREYDAQPMHVDEAAAKESFVGGLIASGWHTCGMLMRMNCEGFLLEATSMGAPGIDEVKWLKPVRPGDVLSVRRTVVDARASRSKPDRGLVRFLFEVLNQSGEPVMSQANLIMLGRRDKTEPVMDHVASPGAAKPKPDSAPTPPTESGREWPPAPFLDDLHPGDKVHLGAYDFTAENIVRFASFYDPQPFHLSEEAGRKSHFGGLVASGWQTAAIWMKLMVAHWTADTRRALAAGSRPARLGPSPGFSNMEWLKPVRPGDTLTYRCILTDWRPSASRPGWGLARHHNIADNQKGERVFEFDGVVLWEMRPD